VSLSRHPEYKPSGIEWLPEVPSHWIVKRIRHAANLNPSKREAHHLPRDLPVDFLPMEAVGTDGLINREQKRPIEAVIDGFTYFREGDVALAKITPCFENGKCAIMRDLAQGIGFGTTELTVLRPRFAQTVSEYLFYLLSSEPFRVLGESEMYGAGGQKRVPDAFVRNFRIAFPPIDEQKQIAEFLNHETAKIDALIEEQQRLIELLDEKRQAVISHAVTKGLDPDAPMKDSCVEWLGDVPAHWDVVKIKRVAKLESGHTPSKSVLEYWDNCSVPWVSLNDSKTLAVQDYIEDTRHKINEAGLANSSAHILPAETVVFTRDATIGLAAITKKPMAVSQHLIGWVCGPSISPEYLLLVLYAMEQELHRATFGATIKTIGMPEVNRMVTPVPPMEEQVGIVEQVFKKREQLSKMRLEAEKAVMLLKERRSALISAAVTGKIDVRNWQSRADAAEDLPMAAEEPATYEASEP